ncbi:MAG: rod shape-determining protein MreD [Nitrospirales bacterium]|nr:rod shape-determining protein MreD [Nitrospirales bacterium]
MIIYIVLSLCVVIVQSTLSRYLAIQGVHPDFCLVLACVVGFLFGEYKGLAVGLTVGLFQDLLSPDGIGVNIVLKGLAGVLSGVITHTVSTVTWPSILAGTWVLSLGCGLASLVIAFPDVSATTFAYLLTTRLFPQSVYNSVLGLGCFMIIRKYQRPDSLFELLNRH